MDMSFVIIDYNEEKSLYKCLESVKQAIPPVIKSEIIYVDSGSSDNSVEIAKQAGVDIIIEAESRQSAARSRNRGLYQAKSEFIQFLDGDMVLDKYWPELACEILVNNPQYAAVTGRINETGNGTLSRILNIDWKYTESSDGVAYVGGAAMWRRSLLAGAFGFPETVDYGEEPYLCWQFRTLESQQFYFNDQPMVDHDLGIDTFSEYVKRAYRCGKTYAQVSYRCMFNPEKMWTRECISHCCWFTVLMILLSCLLLFELYIKVIAAAVFCAVIGRKCRQTWKGSGETFRIALLYSLHTYFQKIPLAIGVFSWIAHNVFSTLKKLVLNTEKNHQ